MPTRTADLESRVLLSEVPWHTYEALLEGLGDRPSARLTYDDGLLEIMTTSPLHEILKRLIGRLIETLTFDLEIECKSTGSMTIRRPDLLKGVEPDESYYLANEAAVRHKEELDFTIDPPPDLAVEIDISRDSRLRRRVLAGLGIPEVWRHDGRRLEILVPDAKGEYRHVAESDAFPGLRSEDLDRFIAQRNTVSELQLLRAFRDWIRDAGIGSR